MARNINFFDGAESGTVPTIGNIVASGLVTYANDAAYEAAEVGSPINGNIYFNTTTNVIRYYNGTAWISIVDESTSQTVINKSIDGANNTITNIDGDEVIVDAISGLTATDAQAAFAEHQTEIEANETDIDNLETLSGESGGTNHGTFTGDTIPDSSNTHQALQAVETEVELKIDLTEKAAANGVATLDGSSKIPTNQLPTSMMEFEGNWNASTNTPTLANSDTGLTGTVYRANVAGTTDFGAGGITFAVGDWVYNDGTIWDKSIETVLPDTDSLPEGSSNLYYTEARVDANSNVTANTAKVSASGSIDTHSDVDTSTSAPTVGEVLKWDGSNFIPGTGGGGGGGAGFNYFNDSSAASQNPSLETDAAGYAAYADAAGVTPVDGIGAGATVTVARTTTAAEIGRQTGGLKFVKDAANRQGEGFNYGPDATELIELHRADRGKELNFSFLVNTQSGYTSDELEIFVYDVTNATVITTNTNSDFDGKIKDTGTNWAKISGRFFTESTTAQIRFIVHVAGTSATAYDVFFDDFALGDVSFFNVPVLSMPVPFVPVWTNVTVGDGTQEWHYHQVGPLIHIHGALTLGSTSSIGGLVEMDNPIAGATITRLGANTTNGSAGFIDATAGANSDVGTPFIISNKIRFGVPGSNAQINATIPFTWASGDILSFDAWFTIDEWNAGALVSTQQANDQTVIVKATGDGSGNLDIKTAGTKLIYATTEVDTHNAWNGTDTFTAPRDGRYFVSGHNNIDGASSADLGNATMQLNGTITNVNVGNGISSKGNSTTVGQLTYGVIVDMLKGETFSLQNDFTTTTLNQERTANRNYISIQSLPDFTHFGVNGVKEVVVAESSAFDISTGAFATNEWALMTGNALPLKPGTWALKGGAVLTPTGATIQRVLWKWATANGDNTTSEPASPTLDAGRVYTTQLQNGTLVVHETLNEVRITITEETTIYAVPLVSFTVAGTATLLSTIYAERIS